MSGCCLSAHAWVALNPDSLSLALELADEGARSDIEMEAPCVRHLSPMHYDLGRVDPMFRPRVERARRYLEARGLIELCDGGIVRLLDSSKSGV